MMRIDKHDIPVKVRANGAIARLQGGFGDASACGALSAEYFSLKAGTDIAPLLQGLENNLCQTPHWGYLAEGALIVTFGDGRAERVKAGDLFYWPPGHTVKIERDAELLMFSPEQEHLRVLDHMRAKIES